MTRPEILAVGALIALIFVGFISLEISFNTHTIKAFELTTQAIQEHENRLKLLEGRMK
jgi:hypothetical protein